MAQEVVGPCLIIDSLRELHEYAEIISAEIELAFWSNKIERLLIAELTFRIFAHVPSVLGLPRKCRNAYSLIRITPEPDDRAAGVHVLARHIGRRIRFSDGLSGAFDCCSRVVA